MLDKTFGEVEYSEEYGYEVEKKLLFGGEGRND